MTVYVISTMMLKQSCDKDLEELDKKINRCCNGIKKMYYKVLIVIFNPVFTSQLIYFLISFNLWYYD